MNELASVGLILLFALLAGHLVKFIGVPEVTGYIVAGILAGPNVFGWITHRNVQTLEIFSHVALGLILFSVGGIFERRRLESIGRSIAIVTVFESLLTAVLVCLAMLLAGQPFIVAILLGAIAIETAAASTLMVVRECNASGPFTDVLTGVIGINNLVCLIAFSTVAAGIDLTRQAGGLADFYSIYAAAYPLVWQIVGSAALGFLVGLLLASWSAQVVEKGETLILLGGCVLLCVGVAELLELSPLVASLAVGATMVNLSPHSRRLFSALGQTDPPLYAIFFVIAGADLNLSLITSVGILGVLYLGGRILGKMGGAWLGGLLSGLNPAIRNRLGYGMLSQAGLAVGLTLTIATRFPELAPTVNTVVLASVVIFEVIGPLGARIALGQSGEIREQPPLGEPAF
jgi:Kef-type K+ transport system membrane component KefB